MGMVYKHREGPCTVIDVWYLLSTKGSETAPGPLFVPGGKTKIKQMLVSQGIDTPTAAESGWNHLIKLDGPGLKDGEQTFGPCSFSQDYTDAGPLGDDSGVYRFDVDINVVPGAVINIYACHTSGVICGVPNVGVTLGFA